MALVVKKILVSDTLNEFIEKTNFNFNQLKLNGGGEIGQIGPASTVKGIPGIRGNIFYTGVGDPNLLVFTELQDNDLYLSDIGTIWECTNSITQTWINTGLNIKGNAGNDGADGLGIFSISDGGSSQHFYYTAPEDLGIGATDVRAFVFGGYPEAGGHNIPSSIYENLSAADAITYLYTPSTGLKQLKFLHAETTSVGNAPAIYSITNDVLYIENTRQIVNPAITDGIRIKTTDTSILLNSYRDINLLADGRYSITNNGIATSIGNLNLISYDSTTNNHEDPSTVRIENTLYGTSMSSFIELKADSKSGARYIYMESVSNSSSLTIGLDFEVQARYLNVNSTQGVDTFSNDVTLIGNSSRSLITEFAIKTYVDNVSTDIQDLLNFHIIDTGSTHTYIDQSVTIDSTPQFERVYIDSTSNYIDTQSDFLALKTNGNGLLIGGTSGEMHINSLEPAGAAPSTFTFHNGSLASFANIYGGRLIANEKVQVTNNWITPDGTNIGIYISSNGSVGIKTIPTTDFHVSGDALVSNDITATRFVLAGGTNYIKKISAVYGGVEIKTSNSRFNLTGTVSTLNINLEPSTDGIPSWLVLNRGRSTDYAGMTIGGILLQGNIRTNGQWISNDSTESEGIYVHPQGHVRISNIPTGTSTKILKATSVNDIVYVNENTAFNKTFGYSVGNITSIGSTLGASLMLGTNSARSLITLSAASVRTRIGLDGSSNTTHYHDTRYIRKDADSSFLGRIYVGSTNSRRAGMYGIYHPDRIGHIWSIGINYYINASGANFGDVPGHRLYGLAYKHTNNPSGGDMASGHMGVWCQDGTPYVAFGTNLWVRNDVIVGDDIHISNGYISPRGASSRGIYMRSDGNVGIRGGGSASYAFYVSGSSYNTNNVYSSFTYSRYGAFIGTAYTGNTSGGYTEILRSSTYAYIDMRVNYYTGGGGRNHAGLRIYNRDKSLRLGQVRASQLRNASTHTNGSYMAVTAGGVLYLQAGDTATTASDKQIIFVSGNGNWVDNTAVCSDGGYFCVNKGLRVGNSWSEPSYPLHVTAGQVYFSAYFENTTGNYCLGLKLRNTTATKLYAYFYQGDSIVGAISKGSNDSQVYFDGGSRPYSDRRLKKNIKYLSNESLDIVKQLKPVMFNYLKSTKNEYGFIAQDILEVEACRDAVNIPDNDVEEEARYMRLDYQSFSVLAIGAIKEHNVSIESLKEEVAALKINITDLQTEITELKNK